MKDVTEIKLTLCTNMSAGQVGAVGFMYQDIIKKSSDPLWALI